MARRTKSYWAIPAIALVATLATGVTPASADTIDWKTVGGWDISFYPGSSGCQAFAVFEDDSAFFIGFDNNDNQLSLDVTLLDQRWTSIEAGKEYSIKLRFGNETPWTLEMDGIQTDGYPGLNIMIDAHSDEADLFIAEFQRETKMEWTFNGSLLGRFTLRGSRRAFDEVIACQRSYFEALSSQADPFATSGSGRTDPFAE